MIYMAFSVIVKTSESKRVIINSFILNQAPSTSETFYPANSNIMANSYTHNFLQWVTAVNTTARTSTTYGMRVYPTNDFYKISSSYYIYRNTSKFNFMQVAKE